MLPVMVRMLNCLTISFQESSMGWIVAQAPKVTFLPRQVIRFYSLAGRFTGG